MSTEVLRPNGDGLASSIVASDDGYVYYAMVDEAVADGDTTYLKYMNGSALAIFTFQDTSLTTETINFVKINAVCANAFASVNMFYNFGGISLFGDSGITPTAYELISVQSAICPWTGLAWTVTDLVNCHTYGVMCPGENSGNPGKVTWVSMEIDYTGGAAPSTFIPWMEII